MNKIELVNTDQRKKQSGKPSSLFILYIKNYRSDFILPVSTLSGTTPPARFQIKNATSLESGIRKMEEQYEETGSPFDLVLLDFELTDCDAIAGYQRLEDAFPQVPVIVLADRMNPEIAFELIQMGAQDFLPKDYLKIPELVTHSICHAIERKQRIDHEKLLQRQLIQAEKLDSLGQIAAGVAHEVKNPLAIIQMGISYLQGFESQIEEKTFSETCQQLQDATETAIDIIRGMVEYSRDDQVKLNPMSAVEPALDAIKLIGFDIRRSKTTVIKNFRQPSAILNLDEGKFKQLIINLMRNSIQAMTSAEIPDKQITVSTYSGPIEEFRQVPGIEHWLKGSPSKVIGVLEIRDNGPGVPEDKISEIFEPFFTTKSKEEGTGLGLSIVMKIVDLHDALIRVKNMEPSGLQTCIYFKALPSDGQSKQ